MMNRITAAAFAGMLAGCSASTATISADVSKVVATAIADAQKICNFVPDAEAIGQIAAAGDPLLATGSEIANAFCRAVAAAPASLAARVGGKVSGAVTVDGVVVPYHSP
jgi:hypothetical protein